MGSSNTRPPPAIDRRSGRTRLGVEGLEDRTVPSVVTVERIEDAADGVFRFTRTGDISGGLTVNFGLGGTAAVGDDYQVSARRAVFAPGNDTAEVRVEAFHDAVYDPGETVVLVIQEGDGYTRGATYSAALTIYDDARHTFEIGGVQGAIWYGIVWDEVDADAAESTAALTGFTIEFDGQIINEYTADFTAGPPVAVFANGVLQHIRFDVTLAAPIAGWGRMAADGGQITGFFAAGGQAPPAPMPAVASPAISINFSPVTVPANGMTWTLAGSLGGQPFGGRPGDAFDIPANATPGQIRDAMAASLRGLGLTVEVAGDTRLTVSGPAGKNLGGLDIITSANPLPPAAQHPIPIKVPGGNPPATPYFNYRRP